MKKIITILATALTLVGCSQYALQKDLEALQQEVQELKALCDQLNRDVTELNEFMAAYKSYKQVTNVVETSYGWTIYFTDDTSCDLRHGSTGAQGEQGPTPSVTIEQDTDGVWYWKVGGEWLLANGKKVPATGDKGADGKDAPVPVFQVGEGNMLQVSYDNGTTWTNVGVIEGITTVPSAISDVVETDDQVIFTLADGSTLTMEKYHALKINLANAQTEDNLTWTVAYTLVGAAEGTQVACSPNDGWKASISASDASTGIISLSAPIEWVDASVLVFAFNANQIAMNLISITKSVEEETPEIHISGENTIQTGCEATTISVPLTANFEPVVTVSDEGWMQVVATKALEAYNVQVAISENTSTESRTGVINFFKEAAGTLMGSVSVVQEGKVEVPSGPEYASLAGEDGSAVANCYVVLAGGYYKFPAKLNNGTEVAAVSADWLWSEIAGVDAESNNIPLLDGVSLVDGWIQFHVEGGAFGNALIAAKAEDGSIAWSWHIWMPEVDVLGSYHHARNTTNYRIMNYLLGATSARYDESANGLYYQWGRKDPFPRASIVGDSSTKKEANIFVDYSLPVVVNTEFAAMAFDNITTNEEIGTTAYASKYPMRYIGADSKWAEGEGDNIYSLWNNSQTKEANGKDKIAMSASDKTVNDPCPAGWMVPSTARQVWHSTSWLYANATPVVNGTANVLFTEPTSGTSAYYPACGWRGGSGELQQLSQQGSSWAGWFDDSNSRAQYVRIEGPAYTDDVLTNISSFGSATQHTVRAYPVRCVMIN